MADYSIFPIDIIRITQQQNGGYSHQGAYALDLIGTHTNYPVVAAFKGRMVKLDSLASGNALYFQSYEMVKTPTGLKHLTTLMIHTSHDRQFFLDHIANGTIFNQGDIIYWTGTSGNVTGDHLHLEVASGHQLNMHQNSYGVWQINNAIPIEQGFYYLEGFNYYSFINGLTINLTKTSEGNITTSDYNFIRKRVNNRWKTIPLRKR